MRIYLGVLALFLMFASLTPTNATAVDDMPMTFSECVIAGGQVRNDGTGISCRLVRAFDFRVYGTVNSDCGEELPIEFWGETYGGVMTYLFEPGRTVELPEDTRELDAIEFGGTSIPCQDP